MIAKLCFTKRKWLLIAGLMLAGFFLAFLVARAARNELAVSVPHDNRRSVSGKLEMPKIERDK